MHVCCEEKNAKAVIHTCIQIYIHVCSEEKNANAAEKIKFLVDESNNFSPSKVCVYMWFEGMCVFVVQGMCVYVGKGMCVYVGGNQVPCGRIE